MLDDKILYIELKRSSKALSRVSPEQQLFIDKVSKFPYAEGVVWLRVWMRLGRLWL